MNGIKTFTSEKKSALLNYFHAQFTFLSCRLFKFLFLRGLSQFEKVEEEIMLLFFPFLFQNTSLTLETAASIIQ